MTRSASRLAGQSPGGVGGVSVHVQSAATDEEHGHHREAEEQQQQSGNGLHDGALLLAFPARPCP